VSAAIGVVDYGMGNRRSVQKALEHVGARADISSYPGTLERCEGLVLPGVGAFPAGMRQLRARGLDDLLRARVAEGVPLLGICLGMQLLFERSEEGEPTDGLGLLPGEVSWLRADGRRLPHIGWNEVRFDAPSPLTASLPPGGCPFYHVHSLAPRPADPKHVIATTEYGERFATIVQSANIYGVQFHPEKSSRHGLEMLAAFVGICTGARSTGTFAARA
jgi:glutamine amidotransferase